MDLLVLKTGALGDVLRTTAVLPGLAHRHPGLRCTWLTAAGAVDLVRLHPLVAEVVACDPGRADSVGAAAESLARRPWGRVVSLDDEDALCDLATRVVEAAAGRRPDAGGAGGVLTGAYRDAAGERRYTDDAAPWFDMGLLSRFGKEEADRRKKANRETHPALLARVLGIEPGEPELPLPAEARAFAADFAERHGLHAAGPVVGMNTGAGGRWESKKLPVERTARLMEAVDAALAGRVTFLVLGGRDERERNDALLARVAGRVRAVDSGSDNALLEFAALVDRLDLLVTSDSLALHVANARRVPLVAFFAPTSAAEIELYGRGESVASTAPDACSYRPDADTSTLTVERLAESVLRVLARGRPLG